MTDEHPRNATSKDSARDRLWAFVTQRFGHDFFHTRDDLLLWRERILFIVLITGLPLALAIIVPTLYMVLEAGKWKVAVFDSAALVFAGIILLCRSIAYTVRAACTVGMVYAVGLVVTLSFGFFSGGPFWLFACAILGAVLLGLRAAIAALFLNAATLAVVGWLFHTGRVGAGALFFESTQRAVVAGLNFLLLNAACAVLVAVLLRGLAALHRKAELAIAELKYDRLQLMEAKTVLDREMAARRQTEERFREMAELMPEIIFESDAAGKLTFVNQNAYTLFRYTPEDFDRGVNALDMLVPEDQPRAADNMLRLAGGGTVGLNEYTALRRDGTTFPVMIHSAPVFRDGQCVGFRGFIVDLTEKKALETQLRQSQKMEAIGTLAGGIAHDFNNILGAILGYAELSLDTAREGTLIRGNLLKIRKAGERARDLVRQILTFSRQSEQEMIPVQVKPIVNEALKLLRASLPADIEIRSDIRTGDTVLGDPTQIHQVLMNLCTNAGHAMQESGGILQVSLFSHTLDDNPARPHPDLAPGPHLHLVVSDTGHGMSPEIVERIFDPFFTTKERDKGTGMGLAVVHGIVKSHGGAITVSSRPGQGTVFTVYLPVIDRTAAVAPDEDRPLPRGTEHILLVDDEPFQVDIGRRMLEKLGYTVDIRTNSIEALVDFRQKPEKYDLVITDMTMPNLTGDQLARRMMDARPGIPIMLCTGYSEKMTEEKARQMGIRAFVMKPVTLEDLARTVRQVLDEAIAGAP